MFIELEKLINLYDGYLRFVRIGQQDYVLVQQDGRPRLFSGLCPHQQRSLRGGRCENGVLTCPHHGYRFSMKSGQCLQHRCALQEYLLAYEGNVIGVDLPG